MQKKILNINGLTRTLIIDPEVSLASVLREQLLLTGCKVGCNQGQCGTCSIIMNGEVVRSCIVKMKRVPDEAEITTIEGLATPNNLHPLQVAWMAYGCAQCGFCSPGFILSAKVLLDKNANPTREEIRDWFNKHRNACRCTGYKPLVDAVMAAAKVLRGEMHKEELLFKPVGNKIYGTNYIRPTALRKVTGTWDYGADVALQMPPGTLKLALVQAEVSHANILGIDTSEAEKMPGVYQVVTHKDVKGNNRISGLITFPTNKGDGWDRPIL
ncbi:MAG: 2Fe-2S iron-sulfur cluster-binding protein, partial [Pelosinus sp.]|nr:2Fe-2S iron-sulfur cluster-binding protein [Pelosinus sp.]